MARLFDEDIVSKMGKSIPDTEIAKKISNANGTTCAGALTTFLDMHASKKSNNMLHFALFYVYVHFERDWTETRCMVNHYHVANMQITDGNMDCRDFARSYIGDCFSTLCNKRPKKKSDVVRRKKKNVCHRFAYIVALVEACVLLYGQNDTTMEVDYKFSEVYSLLTWKEKELLYLRFRKYIDYEVFRNLSMREFFWGHPISFTREKVWQVFMEKIATQQGYENLSCAHGLMEMFTKWGLDHSHTIFNSMLTHVHEHVQKDLHVLSDCNTHGKECSAIMQRYTRDIIQYYDNIDPLLPVPELVANPSQWCSRFMYVAALIRSIFDHLRVERVERIHPCISSIFLSISPTEKSAACLYLRRHFEHPFLHSTKTNAIVDQMNVYISTSNYNEETLARLEYLIEPNMQYFETRYLNIYGQQAYSDNILIYIVDDTNSSSTNIENDEQTWMSSLQNEIGELTKFAFDFDFEKTNWEIASPTIFSQFIISRRKLLAGNHSLCVLPFIVGNALAETASSADVPNLVLSRDKPEIALMFLSYFYIELGYRSREDWLSDLAAVLNSERVELPWNPRRIIILCALLLFCDRRHSAMTTLFARNNITTKKPRDLWLELTMGDRDTFVANHYEYMMWINFFQQTELFECVKEHAMKDWAKMTIFARKHWCDLKVVSHLASNIFYDQPRVLCNFLCDDT